jgi:hypothetical protein
MSQQFRMEMYTLILPNSFTKKLNINATNVHSTNGISLKGRGTTTMTILISPKIINNPQDL